jgi:hypothetical protein
MLIISSFDYDLNVIVKLSKLSFIYEIQTYFSNYLDL